MTSRLQVVSMVMEMEGDGGGGCGAVIPLSSDKMDLRSMCKSFCGASLFAAAWLHQLYSSNATRWNSKRRVM
jgi:hypothetical protein